jgi:protein gp37/ParB-like chromosome segregation protein Spo0J
VTLEPHPLANLLPPMDASEFEALTASIRDSGLRSPLVLLDGKILDGVNRWRACQVANVTPITRDFDPAAEGDPLSFVLAMNISRRHLGESQRAMVAAKIANMRGAGRPASNGNSRKSDDISLADAATKLSVNRDTVAAARKVIDEGTPELAKAVERGRVAVSAARALVNLPHKDQVAIAAEPDDRERRKLIHGAKDRLSRQPKPEPPPAELHLHSTKGRTATAKRYYSIDDWKALAKSDRARIIAEGFDASGEGMNEQTGTAIEWARWSHNTVTGCLHDCPYCYARDIAERLYPQKFAPTFHPHRLAGPGHVAVPEIAKRDESYRNIFANSMSDLFGQWVPAEWIEATLEMARRNTTWNFLTLTKFPQRAAEFVFPKNVWMGTTVDAQARVDNAERAFAKIKCDTKWLSLEPLLEPLVFKRLDLFQWVVIGGASASTKTPAWVPPFDWLVNLHQAAREAGCRIYHKTNAGLSDEIRVREFPWVNPKPPHLPKVFIYLKGMSA